MVAMKTVLCILLTVGTTVVLGNGVYEWMKKDAFDEIIDKMDAVNEQNCEAKSKKELMLPEHSVSNKVLTNKLRTSDFQRNYYRNRTSLLQLHQTVLSNAYKYSFIFQRLNQTWNFQDQPSLFYYYLGLTADVTANLGLINASAVLFDQGLFYPNFLTQVPVNKTIPLFGPRAWRIDDYNDPANWLREPTNNTFRVTDYGAGPFRNYTISAYKINEWYQMWLPNPDADDSEFDEVSLKVKYAKSSGSETDNKNSNIKFIGPKIPLLRQEAKNLPVQYTRPYFDCGRSNKWIVSATAGIYDRLPRYVYDPNIPGNVSAGTYDNLRKNRRVGVATADVDYLEIDINPCGRYEGNLKDDGPNYLADIDRCHKETTICKPLPGFGFQRGGYICECRPGFRYPEYIQGPYLGVAIERATEEEYKAGFHCLPIGDMYVIPDVNAEGDPNAGIERLPGSVQNRKKREVKTSETAEDRRKKRAILSITKRSTSKKRFLRRAIRRNYSTLREIREAHLRKKRVPTLDSLPDGILDYYSKSNSDLGLGAKGRAVISRHKRKTEEKLSRKKRSAFNPINLSRAEKIFDDMKSVNAENCASKTVNELRLPGDVKFGIEQKLERFGRIGLRLSDFLSSFLQNVDGQQDYGTLKGDKLLKEDQLFSEVVSVILAEPDVEGIGLFFDTDQFKTIETEFKGRLEIKEVTRQLFGPYAYQIESRDTNGDNFFAVDRAVESTPYTELEWFQTIKKRWSYNTEGLKKYTLNPWVRSDVLGKNIRKHEEYPLVWESAVYESGLWSDPYFDCDGYIKDWLVSYRVPFFGNTGYGSAVEFRGVVVVDVKLDLLDIDQCPSDFYASNAFMGSARCEYETTYCQKIENQGFQLHQGYRCDCKQGYEFPWKQTDEYFYTGDLIEDDRIRFTQNRTNRFERLSCRMSSANSIIFSIITGIMSLLITFLLSQL